MSFIEELEDELGRRIKTDVEGAGQWNPDKWKERTFSQYYGDGGDEDDFNLPTVYNLLEQTINTVLAPDWKLTGDSIANLRADIKMDMTPDKALGFMETAGTNVEAATPQSFALDVGKVATAKPKEKIGKGKGKAKAKVKVKVKVKVKAGKSAKKTKEVKK